MRTRYYTLYDNYCMYTLVEAYTEQPEQSFEFDVNLIYLSDVQT